MQAGVQRGGRVVQQAASVVLYPPPLPRIVPAPTQPTAHAHPQCAHAPAQRFVCAAAPTSSIAESLRLVDQLKSVAARVPSLASSRVEPRRFATQGGDRVGFVATADTAAGGLVLSVSEDAAITRIDAEQHELVGHVAAECSELVALTLWLCAERMAGPTSGSAAFLATLPTATQTPLLWEDSSIAELLAGSPIQPEARARKAALLEQWQQLYDTVLSKDPARFPDGAFGQQAFTAAFSVVLAHAVYLPSASCFALMPVASQLGRTGSEAGCTLDYDADTKSVKVITPKLLRGGTEVALYDPRPNGELLLATGQVPDSNPADCLMWDARLLQADKYFMMKSEILQTFGFSAQEQFPVYADKFPNQLLAYLRLSRVADPALFAKVSFEQDVELSQMNEYEILQLLMGDCRERLQAYQLSMEEEIKLSQGQDLSPQQRAAARLRLSEKRIISATMEAVRRRLAPIRGIPTKSGGMQDANSDLREIFDAIEAIPSAPVKLVGNFLSWARGEQDPDWKKKPSDKPKAPRPW